MIGCWSGNENNGIGKNEAKEFWSWWNNAVRYWMKRNEDFMEKHYPAKKDRAVNKCSTVTQQRLYYSLSRQAVPPQRQRPWLRFGLLGCRNLNANSGEKVYIFTEWKRKGRRQVPTKTRHADLPSMPWSNVLFCFGRKFTLPLDKVYLKKILFLFSLF